MAFQHAAVWIDHREARLFRLASERTQTMKVHNQHHHFHRNSDSLGSRRERDRTYFAAVADALGEIPEILILGPGTARTEYVSWLEEHRPAQVKRILDNQACDDVADEAVMERARSFFRAADRMLPAD